MLALLMYAISQRSARPKRFKSTPTDATPLSCHECGIRRITLILVAASMFSPRVLSTRSQTCQRLEANHPHLRYRVDHPLPTTTVHGAILSGLDVNLKRGFSVARCWCKLHSNSCAMVIRVTAPGTSTNAYTAASWDTTQRTHEGQNTDQLKFVTTGRKIRTIQYPRLQRTSSPHQRFTH